jgi:hypothetical protein
MTSHPALVLAQAVRPVAIGVAIGSAGALVAARYIRSQLFDLIPPSSHAGNRATGLSRRCGTRVPRSRAPRAARRSDDRHPR